MTIIKIVLLTVSITLFAIGAWPVSIITMTIFITLSFMQEKEPPTLHTQIEELEKQVKKLEKRLEKLEARQAVTAAIEKSEKRED